MAHEESYELIWWIFSCQSNFSPIFNYLDPDTQHWFSQNRNFRNTKLVWKPYLYTVHGGAEQAVDIFKFLWKKISRSASLLMQNFWSNDWIEILKES